MTEFKPCNSCRYDQRAPDSGVAYCSMFGWISNVTARREANLCGRYGDTWEPKPPRRAVDYAATPMVDRVLG